MCAPVWEDLEWCLRFIHSHSKKGFGMLTFVLLKSAMFTITSLTDLLSKPCLHLHMPTYLQ